MARLIYYVVAEYGGKKWTWAWNRTDLIPEKRTDDEFAEAASKAGHHVTFCDLWSLGISKWDSEKVTLAALGAVRREFPPNPEIRRYAVAIDVKVRVRLN